MGRAVGDDVHVTLPCTPEHFAEFIAGLLGRPQTISRRFRLLFSVDRTELESLHHLVVHRVGQQNEATLVQFSAVITFDDDSSVRINSFDEFLRYNEVRPLRSTAVLMNWVFLIKFHDRRYAEKQEISIRFMTAEFNKRSSPFYLDIPLPSEHTSYHHGFYAQGGLIEVNINYTARTWGNDVDSILKAHIESMGRSDSPPVGFIVRHSDALGFWIGLIMFIIGLAGLYLYSQRVDEARDAQIMEVLSSGREDSVIILEALRILLTRQVLLGEDVFGVGLIILGGVACLVLAVLLGIATASTAFGLARSSHVILTRRAEMRAEELQLGYRRKVFAFVAVQAVNVLVGLLMVFLGSTISAYWAI